MLNFVDKWLRLKESLIDFAKGGLDPQVWNKDASGGYTLAPAAERAIFDFLGKLPGKDLRAEAEEIRIVGSMASNQYLDDSDLDVHIVPKNIGDWGEEKVWAVKKWFDENRDKYKAYIGRHPIEFYVQTNSAQDYLSPGLFDLEAKEWRKGPKLVPTDYDPYDDFSDIADDLKSSVTDADLLIGELKRDVIDFEVIQTALGKMSPEDKKKFLTKLEAKLKEIDSDIEALFLKRKEWVQARRTSTSSPEQALKDVELADKWRDANALFKFINRYQYLAIVKELRDAVGEDGEVTPDEVDMIKGILGGRNVP